MCADERYSSTPKFFKINDLYMIFPTGSDDDKNDGGDDSRTIIDSPFVVYCNGDWASRVEFRCQNNVLVLLAIDMNSLK